MKKAGIKPKKIVGHDLSSLPASHVELATKRQEYAGDSHSHGI
jgi:hypothetical protein